MSLAAGLRAVAVLPRGDPGWTLIARVLEDALRVRRAALRRRRARPSDVHALATGREADGGGLRDRVRRSAEVRERTAGRGLRTARMAAEGSAGPPIGGRNRDAGEAVRAAPLPRRARAADRADPGTPVAQVLAVARIGHPARGAHQQEVEHDRFGIPAVVVQPLAVAELVGQGGLEIQVVRRRRRRVAPPVVHRVEVDVAGPQRALVPRGDARCAGHASAQHQVVERVVRRGDPDRGGAVVVVGAGQRRLRELTLVAHRRRGTGDVVPGLGPQHRGRLHQIAPQPSRQRSRTGIDPELEGIGLGVQHLEVEVLELLRRGREARQTGDESDEHPHGVTPRTRVRSCSRETRIPACRHCAGRMTSRRASSQRR